MYAASTPDARPLPCRATATILHLQLTITSLAGLHPRVMDHVSRRQFLRVGALGLAGLAVTPHAAASLWIGEPQASDGYGPPRDDPRGVLDLPDGFRYRILAATGDRMRDGPRPALPDGMEVFDAGNGRLALCCNHEIQEPGKAFNRALQRRGDRESSGGGCTTLIVDPDDHVEAMFVSQSDTLVNCAGGTSPWSTWLTCEEVEWRPDGGRGYGYVYDVDPFTGSNGRHYPALGYFCHEALVVDPVSGYVYLTEDRSEGLLWRFRPQRRGDLDAGRLEALAVRRPRGRHDGLRVAWVDMTDVAHSTSGDLRHIGRRRGATPFRGCEGIAYFDGWIYVDEGDGGAAGLGRVWRYRPRDHRLELWYEATGTSGLVHPDNLRQAPGSGALFHCEDRDDDAPNRLMYQTAQGAVRAFAVDRTGSELAGVCWDPSGRRMFVNLQAAGLTLVVRGPFQAGLAAEHGMAVRGQAPAGGVRRADPDTLDCASRDRGMGALEVEAALAFAADLT